jgi:hypothetical protein
MILTTEQLNDAKAIIATSNNRLTASQVTDLVSIFREYLGESLSKKYSLKTTLEAEIDITNGDEKCAKLVACLFLWQENQFGNGGFAPTAANRTGFNYSIGEEGFRIFKYAFGLFWDIPDGLSNRFLSSTAQGVSEQGTYWTLT